MEKFYVAVVMIATGVLAGFHLAQDDLPATLICVGVSFGTGMMGFVFGATPVHTHERTVRKHRLQKRPQVRAGAHRR